MPGHSGGLTKWFKEGWVDISRPRKGGGYAPCGRKSARKVKEDILNVYLLVKLEE